MAKDSFATTVAYTEHIFHTTACGRGYILTPLPRLESRNFSRPQTGWLVQFHRIIGSCTNHPVRSNKGGFATFLLRSRPSLFGQTLAKEGNRLVGNSATAPSQAGGTGRRPFSKDYFVTRSQPSPGLYSEIASAIVTVFSPRSFWYTMPSVPTKKVIIPES